MITANIDRQLSKFPMLLQMFLPAVLLLSGCAVGPEWVPPEAPAASSGNRYTPDVVNGDGQQTPASSGNKDQPLEFGKDVPGQWWSLFESDELDSLVRASVDQNPTLAAARASVQQARETLTAQRGSTSYPSLNAGIDASRGSAFVSGLPDPLTGNQFGISASATYDPDVFGGNRHAVEALIAAVDAQQFELENTYLTLIAGLLSTAIKEASLRAQLQATREVVGLQQEQLAVTKAQLESGAIARPALLAQQTQLAQTRAAVPALESSLARARHQLSVYTGKLPSEAGIPEFNLDALQLPHELPVTLPSSLVRQRPDIRASEAMLHAATAQLGVATANLYPQFTLSAKVGPQASDIDNLFQGSNVLWNIAAGLTQPLFNGGALNARKRAAEAALRQALAQYRATVLGGFQNVADVLRAIEFDASELQIRELAENLARESLDISRSQFQFGAVSYTAVLDAQSTYLQTKIDRVLATAARLSDSVALFQALGGGWWNRDDLSAEKPDSDAAISHTEIPVRTALPENPSTDLADRKLP